MKTRKYGRRNGRKGGMPQWLQNTFRRMKEGMHYGYESFKGRATRMREGIKQGFQSVRRRAQNYFYPNPVPHIESAVVPAGFKPNFEDIYDSRTFTQLLNHEKNKWGELHPTHGFIKIMLYDVNSRMTLIVKETDTVAYIKYILLRGEGFKPHQLKLSFANRELRDDSTLQELGITNGSRIQFILQLPPIATPARAEAREITHLPVVNFTVNVTDADGTIQKIDFRRKTPTVYDLKHKVSLLLDYPFVSLHVTLNRSLCPNRERLIRDATYRFNFRPPPKHSLTMESLKEIYNERSVHYSISLPQTVPDGYIRIRMEGRGLQLYAIVKESDTIGYLKYIYFKKSNVPIDQFNLFHKDILLEDSYKIANYGIGEDDYINVL
jgi:uncharacterized ubiquitin-like protein YukD